MDWPYLEREAARFFHYTWGAWQREEVMTRADVIAHYLEHGLRESYAAEKARAAAKKESGPPQGPTARPPWAGVGSTYM